MTLNVMESYGEKIINYLIKPIIGRIFRRFPASPKSANFSSIRASPHNHRRIEICKF